MTDYVVLCPPGATVRTVENVAQIDAPVLLERGQLEAWVQYQAARRRLIEAGVPTALAEPYTPELRAQGMRATAVPFDDQDDDEWQLTPAGAALADSYDAPVPPDVAAANPGVRVYQTPNLDTQQWIGKCGVGFHVKQQAEIRDHMAGCAACRRDPRIQPLAR